MKHVVIWCIRERASGSQPSISADCYQVEINSKERAEELEKKLKSQFNVVWVIVQAVGVSL